MPFTPLHVGPGLLLKSTVPDRLSVLSYAAANVVIDLESLYHLSRHEWPVHRWAHTFLAASLIGTLVGVVLAGVARRLVTRSLAPLFSGEIAFRPVVLGGFLGGVTHPLLDGLMHTDIQPFQPFTSANPLLGVVPVPVLLAFCVLSGLLGIVIIFGRASIWKAAG